VLFLERDVPWYASQRDLPTRISAGSPITPASTELTDSFGDAIRSADAVIIGSYVPEGVAVIDAVAALSPKRLCFYDIDTPVTLAKLDRGDEEYLALRTDSGLRRLFSFSGGEVLTRLERDYGARRAIDLYCSVDADRYNTGEASNGILAISAPIARPPANS
jgi:spore maturation protein CgeB